MDRKTEVIRDITMKCASFIPSEFISKLEGVLITALHDYSIDKKETALSTQVETPNEKYLMQFLAIKKISGSSERTLKAYTQEINYFFKKVNMPIKEIKTDNIRYYLATEQMEKGLSDVYLDTKLRYLKSFFKTLRIEEYLPFDPTEKISKVKAPKVIKKPFTDEELEILRKAASKDIRTKAIVEFLASTGCRVGEVSSANRTDINGDRLIITGKGNKQRYVYLNARALLALQDYFETRTDDNEAMFVGYKHNSQHLMQRLEVGRIEQIVRNLGREAGVENCHCHRFRRTMATQALKNGMPIEQVSMMLGHEELSTTQIYARSDESDIHSAHKKYVR